MMVSPYEPISMTRWICQGSSTAGSDLNNWLISRDNAVKFRPQAALEPQFDTRNRRSNKITGADLETSLSTLKMAF